MSGPSRTPDIDAIVVNRDGGDALFRALASLERQKDVRLSAVVIDNASREAERRRIHKVRMRLAPEAQPERGTLNLER